MGSGLVAISYCTTAGSRPGSLTELDEQLGRQLDELLMTATHSRVDWLDAELRRLLARRGKRIRPALLFAAAHCGPAVDTPRALICAAAVELLHRSTLVHDDIMDDARYRGDELTMHHTSGIGGAVLGGDYLFGAGGRLIARVSREASVVWHDAYMDLCDGQARETANRYRTVTVEDYLTTVRGKTAALTRAACELGAMCGGLDAAQVATLARFGEAFGVLFQLVDDLMDVASSASLWRKPVWHDARQGIYTMPVLTGAQGAGLVLGPETPTESAYQAALRHGLAPAVTAAYGWANRARAAMNELPPSANRDRLAALPEEYLTTTLATRTAPAYQPFMRPLLRLPGPDSPLDRRPAERK
jgi:geranylgeranyl pyrophosphate synthase